MRDGDVSFGGGRTRWGNGGSKGDPFFATPEKESLGEANKVLRYNQA